MTTHSTDGTTPASTTGTSTTSSTDSTSHPLLGWPNAFRVLVTGSRTWTDRDAVEHALSQLMSRRLDRGLIVVHGAAPDGADRHAADWTRHRRAVGAPVESEEHPADWTRYGRSAGPRRNQAMVTAGADLCVTFIDHCRAPAAHDPAPTAATAPSTPPPSPPPPASPSTTSALATAPTLEVEPCDPTGPNPR